MIKAEQVPESVAVIAEKTWSRTGDMKEVIAAVINDWPGSWDDRLEGHKGKFLILPLPAEVSDE